jgi:hypothetical protein
MYIHSNIGRQEPYFAQFNAYNMLGISQPCMIPIRCPPVFCGKEYHELAAAVAALRAKNKAKAQAVAIPRTEASNWGCSMSFIFSWILGAVLGLPSNQRTRSSTFVFVISAQAARVGSGARAKHLNEDRCWRPWAGDISSA